MNRRQSHFESVLRSGGRIAGPEGECGALNTKPMAIATIKTFDVESQTDIFSDSERCLSRSKQEHTKLAVSNLFNNPGLQNGGGIDLVESLRMLEEPSQTEASTVVSCACNGSVRSKCPPSHCAVSVSRGVVGDVRRQKGSINSRSDVYMWAKIRVPAFRGGDKWSSYLVHFEL